MMDSTGSYTGVDFPHRPLKDARNPWRGEIPQWEDGIYYGAPDFGGTLVPAVQPVLGGTDDKAGVGTLALLGVAAVVGVYFATKVLGKIG